MVILIALTVGCKNELPAQERDSAAAVKLRKVGDLQEATVTGLDDAIRCSNIVNLDSAYTLAACMEPDRDSGDDYGLRVYVIRSAEAAEIVFRSLGGGDAYTVNFAVYTAAQSQNIVFAEFAAEESYGVIVLRRSGDDIMEIGHIELTSNEPRTLDLLVVSGDFRKFSVGFSGIVQRLMVDGVYEDVPPNSVLYEYDDPIWTMIDSHSP